MLIHWQSHQEYLNFLHETKIHLDSSQRTRIRLEFGPVREKLCLLNLDPVMEYLSAFYSPVGRPAKNQVQIIRSLILMIMIEFTSLTAWVRKLEADSLAAVLVILFLLFSPDSSCLSIYPSTFREHSKLLFLCPSPIAQALFSSPYNLKNNFYR